MQGKNFSQPKNPHKANFLSFYYGGDRFLSLVNNNQN